MKSTRIIAVPLAILFALVWIADSRAQDFEFVYPDEPPLPGEEFPVEDGVATDGILPRIIGFFRSLGRGGGDEPGTEFVYPDELEPVERAPAVSVDPADPEKKPRGIILFGWKW